MTSKEKAPSQKSIPYSHSLERLRTFFYKIGVRQGWWNTDLPLLLAVSGGSDSMALLWMFRTFWKGRIVVAHLNHGIRGECADKDQAFVKAMATRLNTPIVTEILPVPSRLLQGESLEDGARRIRYAFLEQTMQAEGAWGVAVAHTSDDSAETFLFNLLRGSGPRGLIGISERRGPFFRPLLSFSKVFLKELLQYYGIPWREDLSNLDNRYTRNRIRNRLLPLLRQEFNPQVKEALLGVAEEMVHLRGREESAQEALIPLLRRKIPCTAYACSLETLRTLEESSRAHFFRGVAAHIGLRTLSRDRTRILCRLVAESSRWCFQWQKEMFLFCSFHLVAWVDPDILVQSTKNAPAVHSTYGSSGDFEWGSWRFSWNRQCATESIYGTMGAIFPESESLETLPLSLCGKIDLKRNVPEWALPLFPLVRSDRAYWIPYWGGGRSCGKKSGALRLTATVLDRTSQKEKVTDR